MKIVWKNKAKASGGVGGKKRSRSLPITLNPDLPFDKGEDEASTAAGGEADSENLNDRQEALTNEDRIRNLVECFRSQGNQLAEDGKYHEALGKWEAAVSLEPKNAVLHEQKAQVLLEIGDSWNAIKAATQATELEPSWCESTHWFNWAVDEQNLVSTLKLQQSSMVILRQCFSEVGCERVSNKPKILKPK
ncbi:uncharacterized protein LOC141814816 isoform X4 [Curcuma longa]|uniref:uncharacterized protein LOC141814816 isoform X4 n=1 Tax=Curcuma longa TaxID=136217 RepID=UPI003D9F6FCD